MFMHDPERMALFKPKQQASTPSLDIYQSKSGLEEHGALHRVELHCIALGDYVVTYTDTG
jgi:hypothetical protein